jgi:hypothetical protein
VIDGVVTNLPESWALCGWHSIITNSYMVTDRFKAMHRPALLSEALPEMALRLFVQAICRVHVQFFLDRKSKIDLKIRSERSCGQLQKIYSHCRHWAADQCKV